MPAGHTAAVCCLPLLLLCSLPLLLLLLLCTWYLCWCAGVHAYAQYLYLVVYTLYLLYMYLCTGIGITGILLYWYV